MSALNRNGQRIKHKLEDYDERRTMQKLLLKSTSLDNFTHEAEFIEELMVEDGSVNARLLHHLIDEAQKLQDLDIQHEEMEAHGHDAYIEDETEGM
jgi:hypothetical protein